MEIQKKSTIPEVQDTIVMLRELSADEKIRREAYYREKRLHDEATALGNAMREGEARGIAQGIAQGMAQGIAQGMSQGITKGIEQGRTEERNIIIDSMRKNGFTEEQIKLIMGDN